MLKVTFQLRLFIYLTKTSCSIKNCFIGEYKIKNKRKVFHHFSSNLTGG